MEMLHLVPSANLRKKERKKRKKKEEENSKLDRGFKYRIRSKAHKPEICTHYVQTQKYTYPAQVNVNCILSAAVTSLL